MTKEERDNLIIGHSSLIGVVLDELLSREYNAVYRLYKSELYGVAQVALVKAADKFDPTRGFHFRTYASNYMRATLVTEFRKIFNRFQRFGISLDSLIDSDIEPSVDPFNPKNNGEDFNELVDMLEPDDPTEKRVFHECILSGGSQVDLAKDLGITVSKLRAIRNRLLKRFKTKVKEENYTI
jgi:RNA polymerase sigma factor (sigma-70 family)